MAEQISSIQNSFLRVEISNIGATVKSVKDTCGNEYIWAADPQFWKGSAPILFPICGGLNGDTYKYNGKEYTLGRHGYIRFKEFKVTKHSEDEIVFSSHSDEETMQSYPFVYDFIVTFKLDANKLVTTYTVQNENDCKMYFSVGAHEGYQLKYPLTDYSLVFDGVQDPPVYSDSFKPIDKGSVSYTDNGALVLNFKTEQFADGSVMFHPLNAKSIALVNKHDSKRVTVDLENCEYLVLWTVPNAPFMCIEPWNGISDPVGFDGDISDKEGIVCLDENKCYSFTHTITFDK